MSSTIFYRFKSQKDTSRILFDGTGLTVFDLKREIIINNKLGDGTDFQLRLYSIDTGEEYEEDQTVIPRSSTVIVRRSPAYKPLGMGSLLNGNTRTTNINSNNNNSGNTILNATRYVTGKPRVTKKKPTTTATTTTMTTTLMPNGSATVSNNFSLSSSPLLMGNNINSRVDTGVTEEERIARMFATQANEWERTQEEMSSITPVIVRNNYNNNNSGHRGQDEGPPPAGYMCYRCGSRNHWIKNCPTNNDPNFEGKRIKRTTGIPKKFLQNVEIDAQNMTPEEMLQRKIMITDDGKFVIQVEDKQSWDEYQRRQEQKQLKFNGDNDKDIRWRPNYYPSLPNDLKCPITGGILRDAVRTSNCCNKIFSKNAFEDLLLDNDFVCPSCGHEEILLDSLIPEETIREKVKQYMEEHDNSEKMNNNNNNENEEINKEVVGKNKRDNNGNTDSILNTVNQDNNNNEEDDDNDDDSKVKSKKIKLSTNESSSNDNNNNNMPTLPPPLPAPLPFVPMPFVPMFPPFIPTPPISTTTNTNTNTNTNTTSNNINASESGLSQK